MDDITTAMLSFALILIFGSILFAIVSRKGPSLDVSKYRSKWLEIESRLIKDKPETFTICILQADSLLDRALRDKGVSGKTMGERMKKFSGRWANENKLWAAHKIRNQVAHEADTLNLDYHRTKLALAEFKQGLKDIGAI